MRNQNARWALGGILKPQPSRKAKPTPALDALEVVLASKEDLESEVSIQRHPFWQLCKELGQPRWKTELLIQFDSEPQRRVMVRRIVAT